MIKLQNAVIKKYLSATPMRDLQVRELKQVMVNTGLAAKKTPGYIPTQKQL